MDLTRETILVAGSVVPGVTDQDGPNIWMIPKTCKRVLGKNVIFMKPVLWLREFVPCPAAVPLGTAAQVRPRYTAATGPAGGVNQTFTMPDRTGGRKFPLSHFRHGPDARRGQQQKAMPQLVRVQDTIMKAIFFLLYGLVALTFAASAFELSTRSASACVIAIACQ